MKESNCREFNESFIIKSFKTDRIRFNQITKKALTDAIENSGRIDMNLFHAQQARRVVDILYGFIVSPILWKNIQGRISAGRCQSPAVKICMDRQKEQQCGDKYFTAHGKLKINRSIILEITKKRDLSYGIICLNGLKI